MTIIGKVPGVAGIDPHPGSHTAVAMAISGKLLSQVSCGGGGSSPPPPPPVNCAAECQAEINNYDSAHQARHQAERTARSSRTAYYVTGGAFLGCVIGENPKCGYGLGPVIVVGHNFWNSIWDLESARKSEQRAYRTAQSCLNSCNRRNVGAGAGVCQLEVA